MDTPKTYQHYIHSNGKSEYKAITYTILELELRIAEIFGLIVIKNDEPKTEKDFVYVAPDGSVWLNNHSYWAPFNTYPLGFTIAEKWCSEHPRTEYWMNGDGEPGVLVQLLLPSTIRNEHDYIAVEADNVLMALLTAIVLADDVLKTREK